MEFVEQHYLASADLELRSKEFDLGYQKGDEVDLNRDAEGNVFVRYFEGDAIYEMTVNRREDLNLLLDALVSVADELDDEVSYKNIDVNTFIENGVSSEGAVNHFVKPDNWQYHVEDENVIVRSVPVRKRQRRQPLTAKTEAFGRVSPTVRAAGAKQSRLASIHMRESNSLAVTGYMVDRASLYASAEKSEFGELEREIGRIDEVAEVKRLNTGRLHVVLADSGDNRGFIAAMNDVKHPFNMIQRTDGTYYVESLLLDAVEYEMVEGDDYLAEHMGVNYGMGFRTSPTPPRRIVIPEDDDDEEDEDEEEPEMADKENMMGAKKERIGDMKGKKGVGEMGRSWRRVGEMKRRRRMGEMDDMDPDDEDMRNDVGEMDDMDPDDETPMGEMKRRRMGEMKRRRMGEMKRRRVGEMKRRRMGEMDDMDQDDEDDMPMGEMKRRRVGEMKRRRVGEMKRRRVGEMDDMDPDDETPMGEMKRRRVGEMKRRRRMGEMDHMDDEEPSDASDMMTDPEIEADDVDDGEL